MAQLDQALAGDPTVSAALRAIVSQLDKVDEVLDSGASAVNRIQDRMAVPRWTRAARARDPARPPPVRAGTPTHGRRPHTLPAPRDGRVARLPVKPGDSVNRGNVLLRLEQTGAPLISITHGDYAVPTTARLSGNGRSQARRSEGSRREQRPSRRAPVAHPHALIVALLSAQPSVARIDASTLPYLTIYALSPRPRATRRTGWPAPRDGSPPRRHLEPGRLHLLRA